TAGVIRPSSWLAPLLVDGRSGHGGHGFLVQRPCPPEVLEAREGAAGAHEPVLGHLLRVKPDGPVRTRRNPRSTSRQNLQRRGRRGAGAVRLFSFARASAKRVRPPSAPC